MREWCWEFTRRRPDYRALWDGAAPLPGREHRYAPDVDEFRLKFELSVIHDPASRFTDWDLMSFRYPRNYERSPVEPLLEQAGSRGAERFSARAVRRQKLAEDAGDTLYNFDLSRPLGPQIARAQRNLTEAQEAIYGKVSTRRPRPANWREFLRAIDGRDARASFAKIANQLWPGQEKTPQSARDTYAAACDLRDNFPI